MIAHWLALALLQAPQPAPIDLPRLLEELVDRSSLARFPDPPFRACMASSTDPRSSLQGSDPFSNDDVGHFRPGFQPRPGGAHVLLDAEGPGAITRITSSNPRGRVSIWIDDAAELQDGIAREPTLVADLHALLDGGGPVASPLAAQRASGATLHLPIPFARRAIVSVDDPKALAYHVEWRRYPAGTPVTSFARGDLERHRAAIDRANRAWRDSAAPEGEESFTFHLSRAAPESELLGNGTSATAGPRAVTEIRLRVDGADVSTGLRHCVLRLAFDGQETVAVPLGAFFGAHDDLRAVNSWFVCSQPPGDLVARWIMPYRERLTMRVDNAGDGELHIAGFVRTIPWTWDERSMHFHAAWRSSGPLPTRPLSRVRHIDVEGRGVFVGDLLTIVNPAPDWWGDGDETITVDGEPAPSHWGTGAGEHYGFASFDTGVFQAPLHGRTRCDGPGNFGRTDLYRFRVLDAVPFSTSLRYEQEMGHTVRTKVERAACVVYYARPGAKDDAPVVPRDPAAAAPELRVRHVPFAIEAESLRIAEQSEDLDHQVEAPPDLHLSGGLQLLVRARRDGDFLELEVPSEPGPRTISVLATRSGSSGILRFSIDGQTARERFDARNPDGQATVGPVQVNLGQHEVGKTFRLRIEVTGTSVRTEGPQRDFGIDYVSVS